MNDETIALLKAARSDPVTRGIVLSNNPGVTLRDVLRDGIAALAVAPSPAPVPPNPLSVNAKQDAVQAAVDLYRTWKENAATHGGNLHLLMQRIYNLFSEWRATPNPLAEEKARLIRTAKAFLDRVIELEPKVNGAIQMADIHGCKWSADDNYVKERDELLAAIAASKGDERLT